MGNFKLGKMTLRSLFHKPVTIMYPAETRSAPAGLKGHVDIDIKDCIFCGICQKRCPSQAISVSKADETWSIDYFKCVQCETCVTECPKHTLHMLPEYPQVSCSKSVHTVKKPELSEEEKAELRAKEEQRAAKIKAALAAKAAREAKKDEVDVKAGTDN